MNIVDHLLEGACATRLDTPNKGGELRPGLPDTIVLHYTAGRDAESSAKYLCNPMCKASAHLVVGRGGEIFQLAPFNVKTWHAGASSLGDRTGFNAYSIGIEIDNAGALDKCGNSYIAWFGTTYGQAEVVEAVHRNETLPRYWHRYTEVQIEVVEAVCRLLVAHYSITAILGHEEIAPKRKSDPGPAFPLDKIRERIQGGGRDVEEAEEASEGDVLQVTAGKLNIRVGPGVSHAKAGAALPRGTQVAVLEKADGWCRVATGTIGWVSAKYLA
jgi:N-acetylmuramoyl-L-alanine amidase